MRQHKIAHSAWEEEYIAWNLRFVNAPIIFTGMISSVLSASYQNILTSRIRSANIALPAWFLIFNQKFVSSAQLISPISMVKNVLPVYSLNIGTEKKEYARLVHTEEFITRTTINVNVRKISFGQDIVALNAITLNISI